MLIQSWQQYGLILAIRVYQGCHQSSSIQKEHQVSFERLRMIKKNSGYGRSNLSKSSYFLCRPLKYKLLNLISTNACFKLLEWIASSLNSFHHELEYSRAHPKIKMNFLKIWSASPIFRPFRNSTLLIYRAHLQHWNIAKVFS